MFSTPKWLLFAFICFGLIHTVSGLMQGELVSLTNYGTNVTYGTSIADSIMNVLFWRYEYLNGSFYILRFILATIQMVFVFFAMKEFFDWIRGR